MTNQNPNTGRRMKPRMVSYYGYRGTPSGETEMVRVVRDTSTKTQVSITPTGEKFSDVEDAARLSATLNCGGLDWDEDL